MSNWIHYPARDVGQVRRPHAPYARMLASVIGGRRYRLHVLTQKAHFRPRSSFKIDCARQPRLRTVLLDVGRAACRSTSVAREDVSVAVIFAFSVGAAISTGSLFLPITPTISHTPSVAIPAMLDAKSAGTATAARQQTNAIALPPPAPPPPEDLTSIPDKLSIAPSRKSGPPGFRYLAWSNPPTSTMIKVGGPFGPQKISMWRDTNSQLNPAFGASVTQESYFFRGVELSGGELIFDGLDNFRKVRGGLTAVLGTPNLADEDNQIFKWQWQNPETELRISYQKMSHRSVLHLEQKRPPAAADGGPHESASAELSYATQGHDGRSGRHIRRAAH